MVGWGFTPGRYMAQALTSESECLPSTEGGVSGRGMLLTFMGQCHEHLLLSLVHFWIAVDEKIFFLVPAKGRPSPSRVYSHFDAKGVIPVCREVPLRQVDASCVFPVRFYHGCSPSLSDEPTLAQCTSRYPTAQSHKHGMPGNESFQSN